MQWCDIVLLIGQGVFPYSPTVPQPTRHCTQLFPFILHVSKHSKVYGDHHHLPLTLKSITSQTPSEKWPGTSNNKYVNAVKLSYQGTKDVGVASCFFGQVSVRYITTPGAQKQLTEWLTCYPIWKRDLFTISPMSVNRTNNRLIIPQTKWLIQFINDLTLNCFERNWAAMINNRR